MKIKESMILDNTSDLENETDLEAKKNKTNQWKDLDLFSHKRSTIELKFLC